MRDSAPSPSRTLSLPSEGDNQTRTACDTRARRMERARAVARGRVGRHASSSCATVVMMVRLDAVVGAARAQHAAHRDQERAAWSARDLRRREGGREKSWTHAREARESSECARARNAHVVLKRGSSKARRQKRRGDERGARALHRLHDGLLPRCGITVKSMTSSSYARRAARRSAH